jgi:L-fuculose-phosphate aldolase
MMFGEARKAVVEAGREIFERKLTVGTWGNVSVRAEEKNRCVITPSGMDYMKREPEDMVVVDLEGNVIEGKWKPSTELAMHCEIYKRREDVNAIVHAHPVFSSILSVLKEDLPPIIEDMVMLIGERVRVTEYTLPGGKELALKAAEALGKNNAVILANHGSVCVGSDVKKALTACEVLEKSAQIYYYAKLAGKPNTLPKEDVEKLREASKGYLDRWGQK